MAFSWQRAGANFACLFLHHGVGNVRIRFEPTTWSRLATRDHARDHLDALLFPRLGLCLFCFRCFVFAFLHRFLPWVMFCERFVYPSLQVTVQLLHYADVYVEIATNIADVGSFSWTVPSWLPTYSFYVINCAFFCLVLCVLRSF